MVDLKKKLVDLAREATGDDEILVAGDFEPKGMLWKRSAGTAAGSLVGGAVSDGNTWAQVAGAAGGYAAGTLAGESKGVPPVVVLAATPSKLYVLADPSARGILLAKNLAVLHVVDRNKMTVTLKNRIQTRTVIIEDEQTGDRFELEGMKLGLHHMNDLLNLLDEQDAAEGEAESLSRLPADEEA
jgi:hypothetical protein